MFTTLSDVVCKGGREWTIEYDRDGCMYLESGNRAYYPRIMLRDDLTTANWMLQRIA